MVDLSSLSFAELADQSARFAMTGYLHPLYTKSLSEFGNPVELPECGGWLLERHIPNSDLKDAMGCYPLFCCTNWTKLPADIEKVKQRYVTISSVTDPFAPVTKVDLSQCFQLVQPFKKHFVIDTSDTSDRHIDRHHRYYARRALKQIEVALVDEPKVRLDDWVRLYQMLIKRHHLQGIKAFSRAAFAIQFEVPGLVAFRAARQGRTVGMHLWYLQSGVAYSHLAACDQEGYALGAAYALYWSAIQLFKRDYARELQWIDLGAGAGGQGSERDGLSTFKRRWATGEKVKYFCGCVCNWENYRLLAATDQISSGYFPLYRAGELA
jgi:hypothetical protein